MWFIWLACLGACAVMAAAWLTIRLCGRRPPHGFRVAFVALAVLAALLTADMIVGLAELQAEIGR